MLHMRWQKGCRVPRLLYTYGKAFVRAGRERKATADAVAGGVSGCCDLRGGVWGVWLYGMYGCMVYQTV